MLRRLRAARRMTPVPGRAHVRTRRGYCQPRPSGQREHEHAGSKTVPLFLVPTGLAVGLALKEIALRRQLPTIRPMEPGGSSGFPAPRRQGAPGTRHGQYVARKSTVWAELMVSPLLRSERAGPERPTTDAHLSVLADGRVGVGTNCCGLPGAAWGHRTGAGGAQVGAVVRGVVSG
jgi:hypothetical protein